jgi:hypothetical protein
MSEFSREEIERRKRAVFDGMSARQQRRIQRIGYEKWDPFLAPNDPIDIRRDRTRRTSQMLIREFLQSRGPEDMESNTYARGAFDMCMGIINEDERARGMFDFACWYRELLSREMPKE